ncbi:hypothetical protein CAOG_09178 [Capsaspora owczarzaki ATCC 30864]|uniref:hypothetical protein n=1 Tax=Capsaspora owczarzaki (strain ATCC 30864) TaxID=595528 RepID=UPI0003522A29|nr:hypothetical protein CAOG_09178 [Capsaspora owczarzaki ATCC 30864]|eukprot:XP_011270894.1 hypothetical protein CAOG_09178 [Capsaspora owczarzaki ATCC 30864]
MRANVRPSAVSRFCAEFGLITGHQGPWTRAAPLAYNANSITCVLAAVAPPTSAKPAFDAFLSPSGAVLLPSFGALQFPTIGGVRSRIERSYERSSLLIWPRRSRSTSASGPPSGTEAKAPAATFNPSAEDEHALIVPSDPTALIATADVLQKALEATFPNLAPRPASTIKSAMQAHNYTLQDRESTLASLCELVTTFRLRVHQRTGDRTHYPVALAAALPGCGKTRMCLETLQTVVAPACRSVTQQVGDEKVSLPEVPYLCLFLTFSGSFGTSWNPATEEKRHPEHAIAKRLLGSYFATPELDTVANISVKAAMDLIRETEATKRTIDPAKLHIFIAIDEATRLLDALVDLKYELADCQSLRAVTGDKKPEADMQLARRFWTQALGPLQGICRTFRTPTWMMVAGTKSEQLSSAISLVLGIGSTIPVAPVDVAPLSGSATAGLLEELEQNALAEGKIVSPHWRFDGQLMRKIQNVAGLPRSVIALTTGAHQVNDRRTDTLRQTNISYSTFLNLMSLCDGARDIGADELETLGIVADELVTLGLLFKSRDNQLLLFPRVDLISLIAHDGLNGPWVDATNELLKTLKSFESIATTGQWQGWELFCVTILNLRILLAVALTLKKDPDAQWVSIGAALPGTVPGPSPPNLFVDAQVWRRSYFAETNGKLTPAPAEGRITLCPENRQGVDGWAIVHEKIDPVTLALQCKLHQVESTTPQKDQNLYLQKARAALPDDQQQSAVVALLTTSRMARLSSDKLEPRSFVLDRDGMKQFTSGFNAIADIFWSYNPHLSSVARMATEFYADTTTLEQARSMAKVVFHSRASIKFERVSDLRQFLEARAGKPIKVTWTETDDDGKTTAFTETVEYPLAAVPSDKVLQWPYALEPASSPRSLRSTTKQTAKSRNRKF